MVESNRISLGAYTYALGQDDVADAESQIKWPDIEAATAPTLAQLLAATSLIIETENAVAGGTQLIYQALLTIPILEKGDHDAF